MTQTPPRISVVIPTFNRAGLIAETLDAVLAQTVVPCEIIVVDDGSTDDTQAVLAGFGDRVRVLRIANGGDLVARNVGLRAASGDLVAFCDSDDLWMPGFIETMAAQWRATPELVACYSDFRIIQDGIWNTRSKFEDAPAGFWDGLQETGAGAGMFGVFGVSCAPGLIAFQPLFPSCMMVDRLRFLSLGGWDEAVSRIVGGDFATALRVAGAPPLGIVRQPLVGIRKHGGNISGNTEAMNLGDACVLDHALCANPALEPLRDCILHSMAIRRRAALDSAFSRRDFAGVHAIYNLLPADTRSGKTRVKKALASLPSGLRDIAVFLVNR